MAYTGRKNNVLECGGQRLAFEYGWQRPAFERGGQYPSFEYGWQHSAYKRGEQRAVPTSAWRIFGKAGQ